MMPHFTCLPSQLPLISWKSPLLSLPLQDIQLAARNCLRPGQGSDALAALLKSKEKSQGNSIVPLSREGVRSKVNELRMTKSRDNALLLQKSDMESQDPDATKEEVMDVEVEAGRQG